MLAHMERDDRRTWSVNEYFSSSGKDFAATARENALAMKQEMEIYLDKYCK